MGGGGGVVRGGFDKYPDFFQCLTRRKCRSVKQLLAVEVRARRGPRLLVLWISTMWNILKVANLHVSGAKKVSVKSNIREILSFYFVWKYFNVFSDSMKEIGCFCDTKHSFNCFSDGNGSALIGGCHAAHYSLPRIHHYCLNYHRICQNICQIHQLWDRSHSANGQRVWRAR